MTEVQIDLSESWATHLQAEFDKPYMRDLFAFLDNEKQCGKIVFPAESDMFCALNVTRLEDVKVVILGQDPYHGPKQAHGLSFSVPQDQKIPPSLKNIYKELINDVGITEPNHGNLMHWANQGVLLLNSVLSVEQSLAGSHQGKGWEEFTDKIIQVLNEKRQGVVFMLWGAYAQKKGKDIDQNNHLVLTAPHPSPLSAHRGFLGCKHFSKTNDYLQDQGKTPIDWQISYNYGLTDSLF